MYLLSGQLIVVLSGVRYEENAEIDITLIGDASQPPQSGLQCTTDLTPCCRSKAAQGEWRYPNNTLIGRSLDGLDFYRNRVDGIVRLNRRNAATEPTGSYCCEVGTSIDSNATICVTLGKLFVLYCATSQYTGGRAFKGKLNHKKLNSMY